MNVSVHGIDEVDVAGAPTFREIASELLTRIADSVVVAHTHFDRCSIHRAFERHEFDIPQWTWLDSAKVVRRTWLDFAKNGYGLAPVAARLGIQFRHHNAAEDARAAGEILVHAIRESGISVEDWLVRTARPIPSGPRSGHSEPVTRDGAPQGPLSGEVVAFTGTLSMVRREAVELAAAAGCQVAAGVTRATTVVVVGDQDVRRLAGHKLSSKHRKAEKLIQQGQSLRILREADFLAMVDLS